MKGLIKTSTTGKLNSRGFTLIELMIVIGLIGLMLALAVPTTREALTVNNLKKATRQLIGLERQLRVEAVRDQVDNILVLSISTSGYYVVTPDMTPEKMLDVEKQARKFPDGVIIRDVVDSKNEKIKDGKVRIKFGRNNISSPLIIHLAESEDNMTLVINPFLGTTAVYDQYVDVSIDDGLGWDKAR